MNLHHWQPSTFSLACQSTEKVSPAYILNLTGQTPTRSAPNVDVFNANPFALGNEPGRRLPMKIGPCMANRFMESHDNSLLSGAVATASFLPGKAPLFTAKYFQFLFQEPRIRYVVAIAGRQKFLNADIDTNRLSGFL